MIFTAISAGFRKSLVVGAVALSLFSAQRVDAMPILTFDSPGGGGTLIGTTGSGIPITSITGTDTPVNSGTIGCIGCVLSFGGGSILITGSVPLAVASGNLLEGTFGAPVSQFGNLITGFGLDSKNTDLLAYFGLAPSGPNGYNFGLNVVANGFGNSATSASVTNNAVPEPGSLLLLGSGLVGLAMVVRRRSKAGPNPRG